MSNKVTTVQTKITLESDCPPSKENPQYESLSLADIALLDQCAKSSFRSVYEKAFVSFPLWQSTRLAQV